MTDIPAASAINYGSLDEICAYPQLVLNAIDGSASKARIQGNEWLSRVKEIIDNIVKGKPGALSLASVPRLLAAYDIMHRLCIGAPADEYLRSVRLKAFDLWTAGDKTITKTAIVAEIMKEARRDPKTLPARFTAYAFKAIGQWVAELARYGAFRAISAPEAAARLSLLRASDLYPYLP